LRTIAVATLVILLAGGCASLPPWPLWRSAELAKADRLAQQGDYAAAVAAYDMYLAKSGDGAEAGRARMSRDTLASILALQREIARLREDLAKREADLERLKQIDLRLERGGKKP
jgi:hypothetical protein